MICLTYIVFLCNATRTRGLARTVCKRKRYDENEIYASDQQEYQKYARQHGFGQHYQQHGPGSAGAPGYHGPWTAPSQQSGSMGGGPQNMNSQQQQPVQQQGQHQAQQWPQQQFWQMVSQVSNVSRS